MYENFTARAREIMQGATHEANRFNNAVVATEHILLALVRREKDGVVDEIIKKLGTSLRIIKIEVERFLLVGPEINTTARLPLSQTAKKLLELAEAERRNLNDTQVDSVHLLLAMANDSLRDTIAGMKLVQLNLGIERLRDEVAKRSENNSQTSNESPRSSAAPMLDQNLKQELQLGICLSRLLGQLGFDVALQRKIAEECEANKNAASALLGIVNALGRTSSKDSETPVEMSLGSSCFMDFTHLTRSSSAQDVERSLKILEEISLKDKHSEYRAAILALIKRDTE